MNDKVKQLKSIDWPLLGRRFEDESISFGSSGWWDRYSDASDQAQPPSLGTAPISSAKGTCLEGYKWKREVRRGLLPRQPGSGMKMGLTSGIIMRHVLLGRSLKHCWAAPLILTSCESAESAKSPTGINRNLASLPRMSRDSLSNNKLSQASLPFFHP